MAGTPWNKGKTGEAAGWDEVRREIASEKQKERIKQQPSKYYVMFRSGSQPHTWLTGPDPEVKAHRLRWNRMKAQAKFWSQGVSRLAVSNHSEERQSLPPIIFFFS